MNYYALTSNYVWDLGDHEYFSSADHYAINQFNIHQARNGYLIVNRAELKEIVRSGLKRLEAEEAY
jgi:predicted AlkP superfamily phosphohydrolase/phosphomutase